MDRGGAEPDAEYRRLTMRSFLALGRDAPGQRRCPGRASPNEVGLTEAVLADNNLKSTLSGSDCLLGPSGDAYVMTASVQLARDFGRVPAVVTLAP